MTRGIPSNNNRENIFKTASWEVFWKNGYVACG